MHPNPDVVFASEPRRGIAATSGRDQTEARAVLRDLGWEWEEELRALVPPEDTDLTNTGVQAVVELHRHGYRTGYVEGPYGAMRLRLDQAEQVFIRMTTGTTARRDLTRQPDSNDSPAASASSRSLYAYGHRTDPSQPDSSNSAADVPAP
ncbi:hypothetical protein [Streptomyces sp. UNOC14_S4]|uniref:hypothetical protein n=1 Tax=Streptomyces sp. UNOC14_S4 TaxID=2872340 RepID=UPI001E2BF7E8|nr:hypothetical protein [Streptomyces sp. UNOC14_S4]MCC3767570.1 hypothetical protein [Streptomyces sp. UNOC14_S4]